LKAEIAQNKVNEEIMNTLTQPVMKKDGIDRVVAELPRSAAGTLPPPKQQDNAKIVVRQDDPGTGGGWVIITPPQEIFNKDTGKTRFVRYNGTTCNVKFTNGIGILYSGAEDAHRRIHELEHDFHYTVTPMDRDSLATFRMEMDTKMLDNRSAAEKLSVPMPMK